MRYLRILQDFSNKIFLYRTFHKMRKLRILKQDAHSGGPNWAELKQAIEWAWERVAVTGYGTIVLHIRRGRLYQAEVETTSKPGAGEVDDNDRRGDS